MDPLPEGASRDGALYPDGARITDLKEVRDIMYKMQRPAIDPKVWLITLLVQLHTDLTTSDKVGLSTRLVGEGSRALP